MTNLRVLPLQGQKAAFAYLDLIMDLWNHDSGQAFNTFEYWENNYQPPYSGLVYRSVLMKQVFDEAEERIAHRGPYKTEMEQAIAFLGALKEIGQEGINSVKEALRAAEALCQLSQTSVA